MLGPRHSQGGGVKHLVRTYLHGVLLGLLACGGGAETDGDSEDGGDGDAEDLTSGLPGTKPLQALEAKELIKLCEFTRDSYKASLGSEQTYCLSTSAEPNDGCEEQVEACVAATDYEDELADDWGCPSQDTEGLQACALTVADYEACIKARDAASAAAQAELSCDNLGNAEEPELPAVCDALAEQCPAAIDAFG
jgi:hypothetical protein